MKRIFSLALITLFSAATFGQDMDAKSKGILDGVSQKTKSYKSIVAEFKSTMDMKAEGDKMTQSGKLTVKGNKYTISLGGQLIFCDGKTVWRYLKDDNEVQIDNIPDPEEEEDAINPTTIFTLYETGFKSKYEGEKTISGKACHMINLYPKNPGEKNYHTVKLAIDKVKKQIVQVHVKGKDGVDYIYEITSFKGDAEIPDSKFTFNKAKYPGVDVVDMR